MANGELKLPSVQSILVDEGYGVQLAVQHLYDRGHRNISFVMDTQKDAAVRKRNGFLMKMKHGRQISLHQRHPTPHFWAGL